MSFFRELFGMSEEEAARRLEAQLQDTSISSGKFHGFDDDGSAVLSSLKEINEDGVIVPAPIIKLRRKNGN